MKGRREGAALTVPVFGGWTAVFACRDRLTRLAHASFEFERLICGLIAIELTLTLFYLHFRSRRREPVGRRLRQRSAAARHRPPEDRRAGAQRRAALRHLQAAQGQPRLRLQDPLKVRLDESKVA